jgi:hypothetical protein
MPSRADSPGATWAHQRANNADERIEVERFAQNGHDAWSTLHPGMSARIKGHRDDGDRATQRLAQEIGDVLPARRAQVQVDENDGRRAMTLECLGGTASDLDEVALVGEQVSEHASRREVVFDDEDRPNCRWAAVGAHHLLNIEVRGAMCDATHTNSSTAK